MAATISGTTNADSQALGGVTSMTLSSFAAATGDIIGVCVGAFDIFNANVITGITWGGGNNFTSAVSFKGTGSPHEWQNNETWYFVVASGGTNNIVVSFDGTVNECAVTAFIVQGGDTASPIRGTPQTAQGNGGTGAGSSASVTCTTEAGDAVVYSMTQEAGLDDQLVVKSGQTELFNSYANGGYVTREDEYIGAVSYEIAAGTSTSGGYDGLNQIAVAELNNNLLTGVVFKAAAGGSASIVPILNSYRLRST